MNIYDVSASILKRIIYPFCITAEGRGLWQQVSVSCWYKLRKPNLQIDFLSKNFWKATEKNDRLPGAILLKQLLQIN